MCCDQFQISLLMCATDYLSYMHMHAYGLPNDIDNIIQVNMHVFCMTCTYMCTGLVRQNKWLYIQFYEACTLKPILYK